MTRVKWGMSDDERNRQEISRIFNNIYKDFERAAFERLTDHKEIREDSETHFVDFGKRQRRSNNKWLADYLINNPQLTVDEVISLKLSRNLDMPREKPQDPPPLPPLAAARLKKLSALKKRCTPVPIEKPKVVVAARKTRVVNRSL